MANYAILTIDCRGSVSKIDLDTRYLDLKRLHELVGGYIEVLHPEPFGGPIFDDVVLLIDECGRVKGKPVNVLASALYGSSEGVAGDVVLCLFDFRPFPDIFALSSDTAERLYSWVSVVRDGVLERYGTLSAQ